MQTWFDLFENFLAVERYDFCFIIRQRPVRSYGGDESFAGIRETVECFGMLHGTSMIVVVPHQPSGISGQLTTRHERNGEQSMVNRMNRLLGCSLATGLYVCRATGWLLVPIECASRSLRCANLTAEHWISPIRAVIV